MYEVELKFPVADADSITSQLAAHGATPNQPVEQRDVYFSHPARDFGQSDEALRIRTSGACHTLTYKGPVVDSQTKTRREIEVPLAAADSSARLTEILTLLGFQPVRSVRKRRRAWRLMWENREFEISLDDVDDLGTFVEVETLADESARPAALDAIHSLVSRFHLTSPEKRSYLTLLLEKDCRKR